VTGRLPPPDRLYSVRVVLPAAAGDAFPEDIEALGKKLRAKGAEALRGRTSGLRVALFLRPDGDGDAAKVSATVNDWNPGAAGIRLVTLLTVKAGPEWDVIGAALAVDPLEATAVRPRPDSIEQGQTATNAA
jgi:hypothetical protein